MRHLAAGCALLLCLSLPARAQDQCLDLSAQSGWQKVRFDDPAPIRLASISGGWTVDAARFSRVGANGHTGADAASLAPFEGFKISREFNFGALLVRTPDGRISLLAPGQRMTRGIVEMRINDADASLADNAGSLRLCFRFEEAPAAAQAPPAAPANPAPPARSAACRNEDAALDRLEAQIKRWRAELNGERRRLERQRRDLQQVEDRLSINTGHDPYGLAAEARRYNEAEHERRVREHNREDARFQRERERVNREIDDYNRRVDALRSCR